MAAVLDRHMDGREFIVGNAISVADRVTPMFWTRGNEDGLIDDSLEPKSVPCADVRAS